jgi:hypothetical protein
LEVIIGGNVAAPVLQLFVEQQVTTMPLACVPDLEAVHEETHEYVLVAALAVQIVLV